MRDQRARRLVAAGFARPLAVHIAYEADIEPRALVRLTARGCPPRLAARILDSLESSYPDELGDGQPAAGGASRRD